MDEGAHVSDFLGRGNPMNLRAVRAFADRAMRKTMLPLMFLLAACDGEEAEPVAEVQTATIEGLYQAAGPEMQPSRMCILSQPTGTASFALVVRNAGGSCSGAGDAVREGDVLRLTMAGSQPCTIAATVEGRQVAFPSVLPESCAYYCSPGSALTGTAFEKTGGTSADAMRALDPVGDPLCG